MPTVCRTWSLGRLVHSVVLHCLPPGLGMVLFLQPCSEASHSALVLGDVFTRIPPLPLCCCAHTDVFHSCGPCA